MYTSSAFTCCQRVNEKLKIVFRLRFLFAQLVRGQLAVRSAFGRIRPVANSDLDHSELHSPGFADHVLVPRRVPDQLHIGLIHTVDR